MYDRIDFEKKIIRIKFVHPKIVIMKNRFKRRRLLYSALFSSLMLFSLTSCVNEDYDLENDIDLNVTVLKNLSFPVGSLMKVQLSELLEMSDDISVITSDEAGNLSFSLSDDQNVLSQSISVPYFTFEDSYRGNTVEKNLDSFYFTYDESMSDYINLEEISKPRPFPDIPVEILFDEVAVPTQIKAVRYADVNATATVNLSVSIDAEIPFKAYAAAGTEIIFPDWVVLGEVGSGLKKDGHTVILLNDLEIVLHTPSNQTGATIVSVPIIAVDAEKLPEGQGLTADHTFMMNDLLTISGSSFFTFDGSANVTGQLITPVISSIVSFSDLSINSVQIKLGDDVEKDLISGLSPITLDGIPDILMGTDVVLDLNDLRLDVDFNNSSPFSGNISTSIKTSAQGQQIAESVIGPAHFNSGSSIEPAEMRWSFSGGFLEAPENYDFHKVDNFADLVRSIPDLIEFQDFTLKLDDEFFTVVPGDNYNLTQKFSIHAPLAFGRDFNIPYSYEIKDLGFEFKDVRLTSALLSMEVENTIPVRFTAEAYATDEDGLPIEGVTLKIKDNAAIEAGSINSPTVSDIVFELSNSQEEIVLDGLVIKFKASAPDSRFEGIPLNENQSIHFREIVLNLPDGVSADINDLND